MRSLVFTMLEHTEVQHADESTRRFLKIFVQAGLSGTVLDC